MQQLRDIEIRWVSPPAVIARLWVRYTDVL